MDFPDYSEPSPRFTERMKASSLLHSGIGHAPTDAAAFRAAQIAISAVMKFEREGKKPDGTPVKLGFSLAFAEDNALRPTSTSPPASSIIRRISGIRPSRNTPIPFPALPASLPFASPTRHRRVHGSFTGATAKTNGEGFTIATSRGVIESQHRPHSSTVSVSQRRMFPTARELAALRFAAKDASLLQDAPEFAGMAGLYAGNAADHRSRGCHGRSAGV